ncbi:alpha/beta hydrolase [Nonomuraea sp. C10]|uniref:alpha/beta hydrolase n=1 Tax=Nonomuraea sp. C10 TaxID=2600577 RepID=UPI0021C41852|nr:alpha/beta hydrolase [Nonomuraea sp. C10]
MKRFVTLVGGMVGGVAMLGVCVAPASVGAEAKPETPPARVTWGACPKKGEKKLTTLAESLGTQCGTVRVPLDYREPLGHAIRLSVNRIKAKEPRDGNHLGTLVVNPGGPGASGRDLAVYVAAALPRELRDRYDVVGFDPRGVGASQPAMRCVDPEVYHRPPRPDSVPVDRADENTLLSRAADYANRCGSAWSWLLPHMNTENVARDLDRIRAALGEQRISYLGYSYGTYIGAVYATLFPQRVKRLVLDSVVEPDGEWYRSNLTQNRAFEKRHRALMAWTARHNRTYQLGRTARQTRFAWYAMRSRLAEQPAGGVVGPSELDDTFTIAGYSERVWPELIAAWSAYVREGDPKPLVAAWEKHGKNDADDENGYAVYLAVQCRDSRWPRDWNTWRRDMTRLHQEAPFLTWPNAWFNAPCAFWPVRGGEPVKVRGSWRLPPILMLQSRDDAATPYAGAVRMRGRFPTARMVVETGGDHGISFAGNRCVDRHLVAYLQDGTVPAQGARCAAKPEPRPKARMKSRSSLGHERLTDVLAR